MRVRNAEQAACGNSAFRIRAAPWPQATIGTLTQHTCRSGDFGNLFYRQKNSHRDCLTDSAEHTY